MAVDIIVHPDFPCLDFGFNYDSFMEFYYNLDLVLNQSSKAILIKPDISFYFDNQFRKYEEIFNLENSVNSISYQKGHEGYPVHEGYIRNKDWNKFKKLVSNEEEFRIHGAYFGKCCRGVALQLFGLVEKNKHYRKFGGLTSSRVKELENLEITNCLMNEEIKNSKIKYGTVLMDVDSSLPKRENFFRRLDFNEKLDYQFIDEKTNIISYPKTLSKIIL